MIISARMAACFLLLASAVSSQAGPSPDPDPPAQCNTAIAIAERIQALPAGLLNAIARVESRRYDPALGLVRPWPWTINTGGTGQMFETRDAAIAAVRSAQASGIRSIDVGCLQVNLLHHPDAFATLDQAFDPAANAAYAARFLHELFAETGDWIEAAAAYHSRTRDLGFAYRQLVLAVWRPGEAPAGPRSLPTLPGAPLPPPRPFAPPALPAGGNVPPATIALLLGQTPDCAAGRAPSPWVEAARSSACGGSPFATATRLRRILAAE